MDKSLNTYIVKDSVRGTEGSVSGETEANIIREKQNLINHIFDTFFYKRSFKTSHETLATYSDQNVLAGGDNGYFYTHINYYTMKRALFELINIDKKFYTIVETGCSAHGTKSTLLWDRVVNILGGKVLSVDLNEEAVNLTNRITSINTSVVCSDSLKYLPTLSDNIDFLYLDSYDVDFLNPIDSAEHHLKEFNSVKHLLGKGSVILIDDTPVSPEWLDNGKYSPIYKPFNDTFNPDMCGKGSLVSLELQKMGATKIMHQYQVLWVL